MNVLYMLAIHKPFLLTHVKMSVQNCCENWQSHRNADKPRGILWIQILHPFLDIYQWMLTITFGTCCQHFVTWKKWSGIQWQPKTSGWLPLHPTPSWSNTLISLAGISYWYTKIQERALPTRTSRSQKSISVWFDLIVYVNYTEHNQSLSPAPPINGYGEYNNVGIHA